MDQLILGGALSALSLFFLGPIPALITRAILRGVKRDAGSWPLIIYLPLPIALSVVATIIITGPAVLAPPIPILHRIWIAASMSLAGCLIVVLIWMAQYVELADGISMILFLNAAFALYRLAPSIPGTAPAGLLRFVSLSPLAVCAMFLAYHRYSRVSLNLVEIGKFDFRSGQIKKKPARLYAETVFGSYHYLYALLVVVMFTHWTARLGRLPVPAKAMVTHLAQQLHWQLVLYVTLVCWFSYRRAIVEFDPERVRKFLEARNWLLENAKNMSQGVRQLITKIKLVLLRNWLFEISIIIFSLFVIGIAQPEPDRQIGNEQELLLVTMIAMAGYILLTILARVVSPFFDYTRGSILAIPSAPQEDSEESWVRRIYDSVTKRNRFVEFVVGVGVIIEFFLLLIRLAEWIAHRVW